jgi:hypothetical protein
MTLVGDNIERQMGRLHRSIHASARWCETEQSHENRPTFDAPLARFCFVAFIGWAALA